MSILSTARTISVTSVFSELGTPEFLPGRQREDGVEDEEIEEEEEEELGEVVFETPLPEYWLNEKLDEEDDERMKTILDLNLTTEFKLDHTFHQLSEAEMYTSVCKELHVTPIGNYKEKCITNNFDGSLRALESRGLLALCKTLERNSCITELNLSKNCIDHESVCYLVDLMRRNYFISHLDLSSNRLGNGNAKMLNQLLKDAPYMKSLNLASNNLTVQHIRSLVRGLDENKVLQEFDLSKNCLSNTGAAVLGRMLADNTTLTLLDLSWNEIYGRGATTLATALKHNTTLEIFRLACNGFRDDNCPAIAGGIALNDTLTELDLASNRITGQGASRIAKGLGKNESLKILKLAKNPIDPKGALLLLSKGKNKLQELDLSGVLVSKEFLKMSRVARKNRDFEFVIKYGLPIKGLRNTRSSSTGERRPDTHPLEVVRNEMWNKQIDMKEILLQAEGPIDKRRFVELFLNANCGVDENEIASVYDTLNEEGSVNINTLLNELDEADGDMWL